MLRMRAQLNVMGHTLVQSNLLIHKWFVIENNCSSGGTGDGSMRGWRGVDSGVHYYRSTVRNYAFAARSHPQIICTPKTSERPCHRAHLAEFIIATARVLISHSHTHTLKHEHTANKYIFYA